MPHSPCPRRDRAASSTLAASRGTAAASRLTSIQPRKERSAHLPAPLRRSLAKRESANTISPGAIVPGIFGKNAGLEGSKADQVAGVVKERFATIQPIPRAGLPDDIAEAAVFLASDGSGFVNGQDLVIDGGQTSVTRGWSVTVAGRAETAKLIKAAAAAL